MSLGVGDRAPAFTRVGHDGTTIEVGGARLPAVLVLYFYPKDETPGCIVEACGFRDQYARFVEAGAMVVGVSHDSPRDHTEFAARHALPFSLISDADGSLRTAYGVRRQLGVVPGRTTFVIDRDGVIRMVFSSLVRARRHVADALAMVERLAAR
jgi:peroxiredoxin Q/BCP